MAAGDEAERGAKQWRSPQVSTRCPPWNSPFPSSSTRRPVAAARAGTRARRAAEEPRRRLSSLLVSACSVHVVPGPVQRLGQSIEWRVARCVVIGSVDRGVRGAGGLRFGAVLFRGDGYFARDFKRFRLMPLALVRSISGILLIKGSNVNPETKCTKRWNDFSFSP